MTNQLLKGLNLIYQGREWQFSLTVLSLGRQVGWALLHEVSCFYDQKSCYLCAICNLHFVNILDTFGLGHLVFWLQAQGRSLKHIFGLAITESVKSSEISALSSTFLLLWSEKAVIDFQECDRNSAHNQKSSWLCLSSSVMKELYKERSNFKQAFKDWISIGIQ